MQSAIRPRGILHWLAALALCQPLLATDVYVAPDGNDSNAGTQQAPVATIQHARDLVRAQIAGGMTSDIIVHIGAGNYFIEQAVTFDDRDGGGNGHTVTYQGAPNLATRIYGGRRITNWTQVTSSQFTATVADLQSHYTLYENDVAANGGYYHEFADVTAGNWSRNGTTLTYYPRNLPIANQVVVLGTTKDVFIVMGRSTSQIVSNIIFDGLHMIGSDYTGSWPGGDSDFPGYTGLYDGVQLNNIPIGVIFPEARHGQFYLRNAQSIVIRNSKLYGAGFMAAFIDRWAQNNTVQNCWIENTGRDAVYFQGWEPGRGASDGLTTLAASYCNKFNVVSNNVIYDIGRFGGSMGVRFDFSGDNRLEHNIIKGVSGGAYHGHGWRPNMINILGYYVMHNMPSGYIPYPYDQSYITFYDDKYVVTEANQGAELNHCRNNLIQYNDVSQAPRAAGDTGTITQWGAGPNSTWAYNAVHDSVALGGWCYFSLYDDDGSHRPTLKNNVLYWINATSSNTAGIVSKGNFEINTGNIIADCVLGQGGAYFWPFCEEATRMTWTNNIVAAQVGAPYTGGTGTQTPVEAVKSAYAIVGVTDTDANITSICGPNANTPYPLLQTASNNVYFYQPLDRADSAAAGAANLQSQVTANLSRDTNSVYADPLFNRQHPWWDARYTDYALQSNSPALARGYQQFDLSQIGLQTGFPFDPTSILGQPVNKIRAAGNFSRLLKLGTSGSQLVSGSGATFPAGSWVRYNSMDFGTGQYDQFQVHLQWDAYPQNTGTAIELRLDAPDGTLVGTVPYGQDSCRVTTTSGVHDLFLVFPSANIQAVDWFIFKPRIIWSGAGSDNNWTTATNWTSTVTAGETLYFGTSSRTTPSNDFPAGTSFAGLTFDAGAPAYTVGGNAITLTGNLVNSSSNDQVISLPVILPGTGQIQVDTGAKRMTLAGSLTGAASGITKSGTGTLALGTINFTGDTTIEGGTLVLTQSGLSLVSTLTIGTAAGASAVLDLSHGLTERVFGLIIDGVRMPDGSYGSSASAATNKDDTAFSGTGMLVVQSGPCPPTYTTRADGHTVATFTFAGTGTWTVPYGVTQMEVLVVGGGGGCWDDSFQSGSGGGGMYYNSSVAVTPGAPISIKVGEGATQGTGGSSQFGALIAYGGAKGDGYTNGGDQGGYSVDGGTTVVAGNPGYHYSPMDGNWCSGGGAGHAGYKGDTQLGGAGGSCNITGSAVYYAGGGGAPSSYASSSGTGHNLGFGGTGPEVFGGRAISGVANTGGGGGGGWGGGGGKGGSGVVIVAYQSVAMHTVTFNSNGGSSVASQSIPEGTTATEPAPPTWLGHSFAGWFSDIDLTTPFSFSTTITADKTLYAKWTSVSSYTLTYSAGANGTIDGVTSQTVAPGGSGTTVTAMPNSGYQFLKWSDNSTANPRTDTNVAANITVTAFFTILSTDTISPTSIITRSDGKTVATFTTGSGTWTIPAHAGDLEVLVVGGGGGCWNDGFQSGSGAGGMYYTASYAAPAGSIGITVGAGATDGTGSNSLFGTQLIAYGGTKGNGYTNGGDQGGYSIDGGTTIVPGNLGYHYSPMDGNWCSGGGAGHAGYKGDLQLGGAGAACNITGSIKYYAGGGGAPSSYSSSGSTGYNLGGGGSGPQNTFALHAFSGLANTGGGGGGGWGGGGGAGGSGVVIVAYTSTTPTFTVNFNSNGGSTVASQLVTSGGTATQPAIPTKAGYTFVRWYADSGLTNPFNFATPITADTTLYAKWTDITWTVTFNSNGGSAVANQTVADTGTATQPSDPTNTGYTFVRWCVDSGLTNPFNFATAVTANTTLYAQWQINSYTLTYDAGANGSISGSTPQTVQYGGSGTAVTAVPSPGYLFIKWSDNSTANPRSDVNVSANLSVTASFGLVISPTTVKRGDGKSVATFTSGSGYWTVPAGVTSLEVLVVGGGGSGASARRNTSTSYRGGGGAGGVIYQTTYAVTPGGNIAVTVGSGGSAAVYNSNNGTPGNAGASSVFDSLTANGGNGGTSSAGGASGAPTTFSGGTTSGGGGGAGQAGTANYASNAKGGDGLACAITGTNTYYGGGGGSAYSGPGGNGGGGTAPSSSGTVGNPGAANTGGGGSASVAANSGAGGAGVVMVAYQTAASAPTITGITPGNGSLSVAFTAPASNGGAAITNYKYSIDNGSTFTAVSPASTTSPILISGLTNGTPYTVKIAAVNAVGDGAPSTGVSGTPVGGYTSWASTHGLSGGPSAVGKTGIPNLILYAVNANPNTSSGASGNLTGNVLSYSKRPEAVANGDVHYAIEVSGDLGVADKWTEVQSYITNDSSTISCILSSNKTKTFARLVVRLNP